MRSRPIRTPRLRRYFAALANDHTSLGLLNTVLGTTLLMTQRYLNVSDTQFATPMSE
jgi:hypothetical protein